MSELLGLLIFGLASAAIYAVAASGLVVTYTTSGIFNFAHGAVAMVSAFVYWQLSSPDASALPIPAALALTLISFGPLAVFCYDRMRSGSMRGSPFALRVLAGAVALLALGGAAFLLLATFLAPSDQGLPVPAALFVTLILFAPGLGLLIDRGLMRRLHDASPITRIVVPIGLLVAIIQIASVVWSPAESRTLPRFFEGKVLTIAGVGVDYHQIVVLIVAVLVAFGLRILLYQTRIGVAMRAVVASRDLAALNGASPDRISSLAWALGCALAGLAGVLIAPILTLDQTQLTLLVINAYAAAMVGKLRSLPMTAVGALILGLLREAASRYSADVVGWFAPGEAPGWMPEAVASVLHTVAGWITVETVPAIMLFVVLLVVPQDKASLFGRQIDRSRVPNPSLKTVFIGSGVLVAVAFLTPTFVHGTTLDAIGYGVALGIIALSLVPLTGYGGQISLAPLAFAGIGAVVMFEWGSDGNPLALLLVVGICAVVGALVALPALRLKGLYLALCTMAFALFCEKAVFVGVDQFAQGDASYERLQIGGFSTAGDRANLTLLAVVFVLLGLMVTALRRGPFGRQLQAMKDSPAACATLGLDLTLLKLEVFALSAAIAGLGGALLGGWRGKVGTEQFSLLQGALPGLPLVLLAVVGGIAMVAGALLGGMLLSMMPLVGEAIPALADLMTVLPGLAGISLANNPDGAIAQTISTIQARRERAKSGRSASGNRFLALLLPPLPSMTPEHLVVGASPGSTDIAAIDAEVGLDWGRCDAHP